MNDFRPNLHQPEPLPENASPAMRAVDAQLRAMAGLSRAPQGLAGRVIQASAANLPPRLRLAGEPCRPQRPVWQRAFSGVARGGVRSISTSRVAWGRLALAACVVLAACCAVWMLETPRRSEFVASNMPSRGARDAGASEMSTRAAVDAGWGVLAADSAASVEDSELSVLFDTNELKSMDDLTDDLALLVAHLEL